MSFRPPCSSCSVRTRRSPRWPGNSLLNIVFINWLKMGLVGVALAGNIPWWFIVIVQFVYVTSVPGLVLLTFQDAVLLIEQLMRSPIAALAYLLALIGTSQITSLIWNIGGEPVLNNFLRLDIPSWVHRARIRMVSILSPTYFLRNSGAEGLYQLFWNNAGYCCTTTAIISDSFVSGGHICNIDGWT
ncbi:hypothetical protein MLD38_024095 [Melastoma candidum]|uniref:Uncharacterized protein n=1 Tax=Melastoma candidum TaxID=119954 RepID=A0ACB9NU78_9MYRT|nr:hypothetical protein MLD38_024095 [Melastoma candidum]